MAKMMMVGLLCAALAGCATPYQEMGFDGGVTAAPITNDTFRISARGNRYTDATTVEDFVLLKAAETTLQAGRTHFVVLGASDATQEGSYTTPGSLTVNHFGNSSHATYNPGQTVNFVKPGQDILIRVLPGNASPQERAGAIEAQQIIANVGARVKRSQG